MAGERSAGYRCCTIERKTNATVLTVDQDVDVLFLARDFVDHLCPNHTQRRRGLSARIPSALTVNSQQLTLDALLGRSIPLNSVHAPVPRLGRGRLHGLLQDLGSSAGNVHLGAVSGEGDGGGQAESGTSCESKLRESNWNVM
jgi:hypothetical protein